MTRKTKTKTLTAPERPPVRTWDDRLGFEGIATQIQDLWQSGKLPQVLVFEGPEGSGKRKLLAEVAATFYCETRKACGHCDGCFSVQGAYQGDLFWLEVEGTIKVAEADQLQEHLSYQAAAEDRPRLAVIVDLEAMTEQAANRLLKTLEEPPAGTVILASCVRFERLLSTVKSRAVKWALPPVDAEAAANWLQTRLPQVPETEIRQSLSYFHNAPGRALNYLEVENQIDRAARDRLNQLLLTPLRAESIKDLQDLIKQRGWKAPDLAQHFELLINQSYKKKMDNASAASLQELRRIKHWRKILQQVYRAGRTGQNQLNVLLVAEALSSGLDAY